MVNCIGCQKTCPRKPGSNWNLEARWRDEEQDNKENQSNSGDGEQGDCVPERKWFRWQIFQATFQSRILI